ncbi:MAG: hypothetical protein Q9166_007612 [cf. Caloplaca sp. 2 TL-2023]
MKPIIALTALMGTQSISALSVPTNVRNFYNRVKSSTCTGTEKLKGGFYDQEDGSAQWSYCRKTFSDSGKHAIYLHGSSSKLANMDIDCDGDLSNPVDGRCGSSTDTQEQTRWKAEVQTASNNKIEDLNANIHPYVVFGNERDDGGATFDPRSVGIKPLSVMAVVCGDKMFYGVWGDTNGDDGPPLVGEASLSLATACFGTSMNGNNGHDEPDVLYIAFPGDDAVPGSSANWGASNFQQFEDSITTLGNRLIARLS